MQRHLVIMAKEPVMGRAKTRLARVIGPAEAMRFYRTNLQRTARKLQSPRWMTVLAVDPIAAIDSSVLPRCDARIGQGGGDLGARMQRLFDVLPPGPVVIIGTDIPDIQQADIAAAFKALGDHDAVIGPAPDGGYWLIGLKRFPAIPRAFTNVRWSSEHTRADTERALAGHAIAQLRVLEDVDEETAFRRWRKAAP